MKSKSAEKIKLTSYDDLFGVEESCVEGTYTQVPLSQLRPFKNHPFKVLDDDEAYKGHYFINANSTTPPQIVDKYVKPILDRNEVYSGCYARVSLNFYAFNSNGNKGVACGLGNIQKIRDGESLGGRSSATDDFSTVADDDFLS